MLLDKPSFVARLAFVTALCAAFNMHKPCLAQTQNAPSTSSASKLPSGAPLAWIQAASDNELRVIDDDGAFPVRYFVHKIDIKGDTVRDTIESCDGVVARLIMRNGHTITAEEDAAERERLEGMLNSSADFLKRHKRNTAARGYATDLVKLMPQAMIYTYAPGQPQPPSQLAGFTSPQVVIDFQPDPKFQPPTMIAGLLAGIQGRLWIDAHTHVLTRGEASVRQPVNFGWGMLARIYPGGTVVFQQTPVGNGRWIYSYVEERLRIREMMVKTVNEDSTMTASHMQLLPAPLSYQQAIHKLLDTPLPTR